MAYTVAQFETQIEAIITAIDAEDKSAAYKAYAKAEAIHTALTRNVKMGDQGADMERRQKLDGLKESLREVFAVIAEEGTGGMTDVFVGRPDAIE